jgi:hypothetical protein
MHKKILTLLLSTLFVFGYSQDQLPDNVLKVIDLTEKNKNELLTVLKHYQNKKEDSMKYKAACFLISNMDIHYSADYYWVDSFGTRINFQELSYNSFNKSILAFDSLKKTHGKLHPVVFKYKDIDTIKASFLIDNIDRAFKIWNSPICDSITFTNFCEYILPYRISVEPLQNWREKYESYYKWMYDSVLNYKVTNMVNFLIKDINRWFTCMYDFEKRNEPLPRLGALQLMLRQKGFCEDIANLSVFALRSQGIGASTDIIPLWATSTGGHTLNYAIGNYNSGIKFDVLFKEPSLFRLQREPGKVLRITYSKQASSLAMLVDSTEIPANILRTKNMIDVTHEYWKTTSFKVNLFNLQPKTKIVYASVLNHLNWQPIWWSNQINNNSVEFGNMSMGVVYLPQYYVNRKMISAGYPIAVGYNHILELKPDTLNKRTITLSQQENYLIYQTGKRYKLFYWDSKWHFLGTKIPKEKEKTLIFDGVPKNALLLLLPEYTKQKERPFIITDDNRRIWF